MKIFDNVKICVHILIAKGWYTLFYNFKMVINQEYFVNLPGPETP